MDVQQVNQGRFGDETIMSEDITYCISECNDMKCFRNKRHIKLLIPHSFAFLEWTEDCHKMQKSRK